MKQKKGIGGIFAAIVKRIGKLFKKAHQELSPSTLIIIASEISLTKDYKEKTRIILDRLRPHANPVELTYIGFVDLFLEKIKDGKLTWLDAAYLVEYIDKNIEKPTA
jgi:hypothetical protein